MTDVDDRPSIAELQRVQGIPHAEDLRAFRLAAPAILEIAAAALALRGQGCTDPGCTEQHSSRCSVSVAETALDAALAKVRP
jgi:hypothetical protein